jgi:phage terminase large subunit-like protein
VDPAITARNDETGIVVVKRVGERAYVLDDCSGTLTPEQWAEAAVDAAKRWGASCIVAETNRGGDLVKTAIRQFDRAANVREVHANRGKDTRAEPVAALYEQRRVFHRIPFEKLERQMVSWNPTSQDDRRARHQSTSPDRMDALVWALTELRMHIDLTPDDSRLERIRSTRR